MGRVPRISAAVISPKTAAASTTRSERIPAWIIFCSASSICRPGETHTGVSAQKSVIASTPGELRVRVHSRRARGSSTLPGKVCGSTYETSIAILLSKHTQMESEKRLVPKVDRRRNEYISHRANEGCAALFAKIDDPAAIARRPIAASGCCGERQG